MKKQLFAIVLILSYKLNGVGLQVARVARVARAKPISNYGGYSLSKPSSPTYGYSPSSPISLKQVKVLVSVPTLTSKISVTDNLGNTYTCNNQFLNQNATYSNFRFDDGKITLNTRFTGPKGSKMVRIGSKITLKNCTLNNQQQARPVVTNYDQLTPGYDQLTPQEIRNSRK